MFPNESVIKASVLIQSAIRYRSILHGLDRRRINVYRIYYSKLFSLVSNLCLLILFLLPFFEWPSSLTRSSYLKNPIHRPVVPCGILEGIEFICLCVFLFRAVLLAYLFWRTEFLRNKWLIGQFIVLIISYADLTVSMATGCSEFYRVRRFLRPYFLISSSQMLKKTIKCLWNTLPELASFLLLLMLWILSSTVAAMCLFSGPLRQKSGNLSRDPSLSSKRRGLGWLYETFYNLIILLTTANHPDVILSNYNENRAASFFDIIFLAVGTYIFMNIFTAIMYNQFRGYLHSSVEKRIFRRRVAVRAAFEVLKSRDLIPVVDADKILQLLDEVQMPSWKKAVISTKLMAQYDGNPLKVNEFMDVFRLLDLAAPPRTPVLVRQFTSPIASQVQLFCLSNLYRKIELFLSIVNVVCIVLQLVAFEDAETPSFAFLMINTCFAGVYMLEIGVSVWIHGWRASLLTPVTIFDLVVSTSNLALRLLEIVLIACGIQHFGVEGWSPYDFSQLANLLVILRTLRFTQTSSLMTSVLVQMPCHLSPVLGVLVSVYYIYALLGLSIFRGTIQHPTNTSFMSNETYECGTYQQLNYWAINFDDFAASIYTLWSLMVLNNWHVIVKAFSDELGRWVHIYTLSWWLIVAVVLLTLTTAMIIESFLFARQMHARRADLLASRKRRRTNPCALAFVNALTRNRQDDVVHEDEEELMPAFEHPREHINSPPQPPTPPSPEDDGETVLVQPPPSAVVYSFAQMFGQNLTEPTNEEMLHHLHRHREIGALISS